MKPSTLLCPLLLAAAAGAQAELTVEVDTPAVRVVVPGLPAVRMEVHPEHAKAKHLRLFANEGAHTFTLVTPTADAGMKAQDCANFIAGDLPRRPGVPPQDGIHKMKLDANTYMAMYISRLAGDKLLLNAHLISSGSGNHCVEFVATREVSAQEEAGPWFRGFAGARIEPR